jgi:hypothetical protein
MNKTPEEVKAMAKGIITPHVVMLLGMMDKVPDAMKAGVKKLHDDMNEFLSGFGPMEQVPAAQAAGWAMDSLIYALSRFGESLDGIKGMLTTSMTMQTELNGLKGQIKDGLLIPKETVQSSIELAKDEGRKSLLPEIAASRKSMVELAGLPNPGESILGLPQADFTGRLDQAKKNVTALAERGMKLGGKGDAWVKQNAWMASEEFAGSMKLIEDLHPKTTATPGADPLLGAPGQTTDNTSMVGLG